MELKDLDGLTTLQLIKIAILQFIYWFVAGAIVFEIMSYITTGHLMAWN